MIAATFGAGQVAYSLLWFFLFLIEIWLMIAVFLDIFRSDDLKGWQKAIWVVLVLVFPLIGILLYLIVRGSKMRMHEQRILEQNEKQFRRYSQGVARSASPSEELARLAELRDRGEITADEYRALKAQIVNEATMQQAG